MRRSYHCVFGAKNCQSTTQLSRVFLYLKVRPVPEVPDPVLAWFTVSVHEDGHEIVGLGIRVAVGGGVALGLAQAAVAFLLWPTDGDGVYCRCFTIAGTSKLPLCTRRLFVLVAWLDAEVSSV